MKLVVFPLLLALALAACKKSAQTPTTTSSPRGAQPDPLARDRARSTDAPLRDAMLHLRRVHFGHDAATLLPAARDALARAAELLVKYPDVHIYVDGHTDDRGTTEYNVALGERRANAAIDYLVRMGIARERLHAVTWGEERPATNGVDPSDRAINRRVDFRLARGTVELHVADGVPFTDDGTPLSDPAVTRID